MMDLALRFRRYEEPFAMVVKIASSPSLYEALLAEGFQLPEECRDVELHMPVDGLFFLRYEVNVYGENLAKVGRALARIGAPSHEPMVK